MIKNIFHNSHWSIFKPEIWIFYFSRQSEANSHHLTLIKKNYWRTAQLPLQKFILFFFKLVFYHDFDETKNLVKYKKKKKNTKLPYVCVRTRKSHGTKINFFKRFSLNTWLVFFFFKKQMPTRYMKVLGTDAFCQVSMHV